jgi:hypothetical protein
MRPGVRLGFTVPSSQIRNAIFTPRYYDPSIEERLEELDSTHDLVSLQELIDNGELQLRQGRYIDKLNYGTGPVPYIRTSDIANWELRGSPKHGMSEAIADQYRALMDVRELDVLLVHEGTYLIGTSCLLTRYDTDILFQHHLAKLRAAGDRVDGPLLIACLLAPVVQRQIRARQFTADVIDSIVGRLPEVKLPLHRSESRRKALAEKALAVFSGRAEARVRLAVLCRELDAAAVTGDFQGLDDMVFTRELTGSGHVSFLGTKFGAQSFTITTGNVEKGILLPRYYDPGVKDDLHQMTVSCDLVSIGELVRSGVIELQTGDEVGKLAYGGGRVSFVRTSDFGNWELKHDPKQRVSMDIYEKYSGNQSAQTNDILLVRDGTYLVGTTTIVQKNDLPLLFSGGIYRLRVREAEGISAALLLALLNMRVVRRQMRNKQFTRDVIDTLGHRLLEVIVPVPRSSRDRALISSAVARLLKAREELRVQAEELGSMAEAV